MRIVLTRHAELRIRTRNICKGDVFETLKYPDKTIKRYGKYYFQKKLETGTIEICCERKEKIIKVITVYWL